MNTLPTTARCFGERLSYLRCLQGLTQAALADKVGLSLRQISRIEKGVSSPSYMVLEKIALALDTSLINLFIFNTCASRADCSYEGEGHSLEKADSWEAGLLSSSLKGICVLGAKSEKMNWSEDAYTLLGYQPYSIMPTVKRFLKNVHPDFQDEAADCIARVRHSSQGDFLLGIVTGSSVRTIAVHAQKLPPLPGDESVVHLILQDISDVVALTQTLVANRDALEMHVRNRNRDLELAVEKFQHEAVERAKAEQNLKLYELMVNNSQDAQIFVDKTGLIKTLNSAYERLTGFSSNELIGTEYAVFICDRWGESFYGSGIEPLIKKTMQSGEITQLEGWGEYQSGARFVRRHYAPCLNNGDIVGVVVTIHDLTDMVKIQEQLAESEQRFRTLVEHLPVMINAGTQECVFSYWNSTCEETTGYSKEEIIGNPEALSLLYPDIDCRRRLLRKLKDCGQLEEDQEWTLTAKDGSLRTIICKILPLDVSFAEDELWAVCVDITARKRAEEALHRNQQYLTSVLATQQEMICRSLPDTTLTFVNDAYCRMLNISVEEALGKKYLDFVPREDHPYILDKIARISAEHPRETFLHKAILADGAVSWQEWTDLAVFDAEKQVVEIQSVGRDVTALKMAEETMRQREKLLEATARAVFRLLHHEDLESCIQDILADICSVTDSDRSYVFRSHLESDTGKLLVSQIHEWVQPGVTTQMENPDLHDSSMIDFFPRWLDTMQEGKSVMGHVRDFPDSERMILEPQEIQSLLVMPIMVDGAFWGFMGLDSVHSPRIWTDSEESTLRFIASAIGQAVMRQSRELKIVEQNHLLQWLFDNLPLGVALLNEDGRLVQANRQLFELTGYSADEIPSLAEWLPLAYPDHRLRQQVMDDWERKPHTGDEPHEYPVTCKSGASKAMEFRWTHLPNDLSIVTMVDISERKRLERRLYIKNWALDSTSDAVALADLDGHLTYVNSAFLKLWGLEREEEALGRHVAGFWYDVHHAANVFGRVLEGIGAGERMIARKTDGSLFTVQPSANIVRDGKGHPICMMALFRDMTEQERYERELLEAKSKTQAAHQRLLSVMNNINSVIYVSDLHTHEILFMNEYGQKKWGNVEGRRCWEVIHPDQSGPCSFCNKDRLLDDRGNPAGPLHWVHHDQEDQRWFECHESAISWIDGRLVHMHYAKDVTELKLAEVKASLANQQLQVANAEKDKLFSIIAHDLRAPMSGLLSSTAILAEELDTFSAAELRRILEELHKSSKNTSALLENLLQWATMKQGVMDFSPGPCSLNELVNMSLYTAQRLAKPKAIRVLANIPSGLTVMVDQHMANTVIRNILFNAVKFTRMGGEIFITAKPEGEYIRVSFQDNGIGIDPKILPDLFAVSRKKRQLGTAGEKGTGLGMVLCKEFVEKHGGQIWVESEPGKGTTVHITLPASIPGATQDGEMA